ncbi:MAG: DUF5131 family protein [Deltaproteobacteria bacterium]|nr:DUF5131 family protein [Deltaproteobacteria bacterium]
MSGFDRQDDKTIRPWCKWQWSPITGCRHDCSYCAPLEKVRKLYSRTKDHAYASFEPRLWPERFDAPYQTAIPESSVSGSRNVLLGTMGDIFGDWVDKEHIEAVLDIVRETPQWNYILVTKYPKRYLEFTLSENCWAGIKVDKQHEVKPALECLSRVRAPVRFVLCDPMVVWLSFPSFESVDWLVIGAKPKTKDRPGFDPPKIWVSSLAKQAWASGCKVFVKHLKDPRYRSYPGDGKSVGEEKLS